MGPGRGPSSSLLGAPTTEERWERRGQWAYLLIFAFSLTALAIFLRYHVASLYQNQIDAWEARLSSAADDRTEQVSSWLEERRSDADLLATRPTIRRALQTRPGRPSGLDTVAASDLQKVLDDTARIYGYQGIYLMASSGDVLAHSSAAPSLSRRLIAEAQAAMQSHQAQIEVTDEALPSAHVDFVVPILANGSTAPSSPVHGEALGAGALIVDASKTLFRLLVRDNASTQTAETILVRREGNEAIYFSPLRHRPGRAPGLRVPLEQAPPQVLDALNGRAATSIGIDYRGASVLTATRRIPLAGWGLIRKIDRDEAMAPLRRQLITEGVAAGFWILLVGGALIAHRRRALAREGSREHERLRAFLDLAPDAIYIIDPTSLRILGRNKKAAAMDGYGEEELAGLTAVDLHPPEEREEMQERLTGGREHDFGPSVRAHYHRRKSGENIPVEESQTRVKVGGQEFIVTIFHDVSDRQRAEQKLAESEERYRSVVAALAEGIVLQDESGAIIACNPSAERILGLTLDQMCGRTSIDPQWKAIHEDGLPFPGETHPAMVSLRTGEPQTNVLMGVQKPDGTTSWISINSQPIWGEDRERPRAVVTSFSDVTARQQAEEKLRRSEAELKEAQRIAHVGNWRLDLASGRVVWSEEIYHIIGLDPSGPVPEFEAQKQLVTPESWERMRAAAQEMRATGRPYQMDIEIVRPNSDRRWATLRGEAVRNGGGQILALRGTIEDITERKLAEERLRRSEESYRTLFESIDEGFCTIEVLFDENGKAVDYRFLEVNPSFEKQTGIQNARGRRMRKIAPHHEEYWFEIYGRIALTGEPARFENRAAQLHRWYDVYAFRVGEPQEHKVAILFDDITKRKETEEALRGSETRFRTLIDKAPMAVGISRNGITLYVNNVYLQMFGFQTQEELVGRSLGEQWAPSSRDLVMDRAHRRSHGEAVPTSYEATGLRRDGTEFPVAIEVASVELPDGPATIGFLTDISRRRMAEEALVKLKKAVDTSGEVIFMTGRDGVITFINAQFTRLYGYTEAEVVGKTTPRILKSGNMNQEEYASFWNTILSKQVARVEMVNRTKDGRLVNIEATANPILDEKGEIAGFLAIQRDVTQHLRLEQQFRQAQKMEAVGQLAGGVAHDFNNLLTVINGYSEVLQERLKPDDPHQKYVGEIKKAGERAAGLTRQLLAFSRQQVLAPQVLDVNKVIAGVHSMLNRIIGEDIELVTVPAEGLGLVKADPGQLEQVLLNLAVNSRDAMPRGGRLTIETGNIQISDGHHDGQSVMPVGAYVLLAVSDSGSGMDAATQKRIFEPFFTTKEKGKGTGLGLSTVYGIVKQSGGYIWVYSEVGRGTTFKVYLPRIDEPARGVMEASTAAEASRGTETILFAEDDDSIRKLVSETLERRGYTVLKAADAAEALALLQEHQGKIHLLLTDLVMPGMSGRVLAERVTTLRPEVKVLYISGYTDDVMMRHGGIAPGTMFLQKPFAPDVLAAKVREALDDHTPATP